MVRASARRPLPALAFLLGLSLLTALVWWRVIHRANVDQHPQAQPSCPTTAAPTVLPQPGAVSVNILNGTATAPTPRNGLASSVSAALRADGFQIATVGNDNSGTIAGVGEIRYVGSGAAAAKLISFYLPGATLVPTSRTDLTSSLVEVSVGLKFVRVATAAQVKQEMLAAHVGQTPPRAGRLAATPGATARSTPHPSPTC